MFASAVIAPNWEAGIEVAMAQPDLVVVTRDGDRFAASGWRVASGRSLVTKSTVDEAGAQAEVAEAQLAPARLRRDEADARVREARSQLSSAATQLVKVQGDIQHLFDEIERLGELRTQLESQGHEAMVELESLKEEDSVVSADLLTIDERLPSLRAAVEASEERATWANEARTTVEAHREHVSSLALTLSRREAEFGERRRLIEQRRGEVEARLEGRASERDEATVRRERLEFELRTLEHLAVIVDNAGEDVRLSQEALASTYREQLEVSRAGVERLEELQRERNTTEARLVELSEAVRADEIENAELVVRVNNLYEAIRRDLVVEPEELGDVTTYELPDDVTIEQRVSELENRMNSLGLINPLALEELSVLEDRYKDLDAQVSDVRNARRELQEVLRALDDEIMTLFSAAVADVNEHFSTLIAMLFPGGQGRLLLTEPDDPLNTGVEIEVRPMGRNIRRVSLLSGGERSMAALAFLFAVFRSRPSPFYMMDEVEAALDDVNLQRFLGLVDEFRHEAQLLIVTHQKRTMEAADSLYGVTMAPGGSSRVVSQRVRATSELETA
jgi:chromosome segregation protein